MFEKRKPKLLQISSYPPPHAGWGVRVRYLKKGLEEKGYQCLVLNVGKSRKIKNDEYICVYNFPDYVFKVLKYSLMGFRIHAHMNGDSPKGFILSLTAGVIGLFSGKKLILTFHAGPIQRFFPIEQSRILFPVFYLIFLLAKKIICNNQAVKERIQEYGVPDSKIFPIPAFSQQYLRYNPVSLPDDLDRFFGDNYPVIFSYIRLRNEFDLETLLSGIQILSRGNPKFGVIICGTTGSIDEDAKLKFYSSLKSLYIEKSVYLVDDLSHDGFLTVLKRSALYLRTPQKDGVASSVLESLSLQVPVVASENGSRPQGVITYQAGDPEDLAEKVNWLMNNYSEVKKNIYPPKIEDTLVKEIELLVK